MTNKELPNKLRAKEISHHFSISISYVWILAKQKKLRPIKISERVTLFDKNEVLEFFNTSKT